MAESNNFEIVKNANPTLVSDAQAQTGIRFNGQDEYGIVKDGDIKKKENAKFTARRTLETYDPTKDAVPQADTNPFDPKIKEKNDLARQTIIPLLNPMSKTDGIRLNSIAQEVSKELAIEEAKPKPDEQTIERLKTEKDLISKQKELGTKGRDGIVFPPRVEGENSAKIIINE